MAWNKDIVEGNWRQFVGEAREVWGQITNDEWERIGGQWDQLVGPLQRHYGWAREQAKREIAQLAERLKER
jgi:uncharacterized protein YjbJ (UPF0337 family)